MTFHSLGMVSATTRVRGLDDQQGDEEETGGSRKAVLQEDVERSVDSETNNPKSCSHGRSEEGDDDTNKKEAAWFPGPKLRGNGLEKGCLLGMVEGGSDRGRQRTKLTDGNEEVVACETIIGVPQLAGDRRVWRSIPANINVDTHILKKNHVNVYQSNNIVQSKNGRQLVKQKFLTRIHLLSPVHTSNKLKVKTIVFHADGIT